jgi:hypothetical protein
MDVSELVGHYGGYPQAAENIGVTRQAIYLWRDKGKIPWPYQLVIERETGGKLKAVKE